MLRALLFDMDGTITRPHIDWKTLRELVGAPDGMTIMAYLDTLAPPDQARASAILEEVETEAAEQAVLNPGAAELLCQVRACPLKLALITNNHRRAMLRIVEKFSLDFDLLLSREDAPVKPAPDLLLLALERFNLRPAEAWFVGDGRYDQEASQAAGIRYLHLAHDPQAPIEGPAIYTLNELWFFLAQEGLQPPQNDFHVTQ